MRFEENVRLAGLSYLDPRDIHTWSGIPFHLFKALQAKGCLEIAVGVEPDRWLDNLLKVFVRIKNLGGQRTHIQVERNRFRLRRLGEQAEAKLRRAGWYSGKPEVILATTTLIDFEQLRLPVFNYMDATLALAYKYSPYYQRGISRDAWEHTHQAEKHQLALTSGVLCFSQWVKDSCLKDYQLPAEKLAVIGYAHNLPDVPEFCKQEFEQPSILFICTDFARKGGTVVLKAVEIARQSRPDLKLVIAGRIPDDVLQKYQHESWFGYAGIIDKDKPEDINRLIELYRQAAVFILPSVYDPMPAVIFEAMYLQNPVVASDVCAIPEQVADGESGFIIHSFEPEEYADKILLLMNNPDLRRKMGERGREIVKQNFTWEKVAENALHHIFKQMAL